MRALTFALTLAVFGTFLVATAPSGAAAAYCVDGVVNSYPQDSCDGVACAGYNQNGWMTCVPNVCSEWSCVSLDILCQFQTDCCHGGLPSSFYCP